MRYTPYGIGHPTVLREMTRNCASVHLVDNPESDDNNEAEPCNGDDEDDAGGFEVDKHGQDEEEEITDEEECDDDESIDDPGDEDGVYEEDNSVLF